MCYLEGSWRLGTHSTPGTGPRQLGHAICRARCKCKHEVPCSKVTYFQDDRDGSHPPKKENNKCWQGRRETERLEPWGQPWKQPGASSERRCDPASALWVCTRGSERGRPRR